MYTKMIINTIVYHVIIGAIGGEIAFKMSILELGPILFGGNEGIIDFFRQHHLLASRCYCAR